MSLPNVVIKLGNGGLGRISATDDGVAGLIVTGSEVSGKLVLNTPYILSSPLDLVNLGINEDDKLKNPLAYKDVNAFYKSAGDGAELHLIVVSDTMTLTQICATTNESPLRKLINSAGGRIRIVGVNVNPSSKYNEQIVGTFDNDCIMAAEAAQSLAESLAGQMYPFRVLLPALCWQGTTATMFKPRENSFNRVGFVMASDTKLYYGRFYSAAIGLVLGRAAKIPVNVSIARVRDGSIAMEGFLTDGEKPETHRAVWDILDEAGFIFYRTFIGKSGYYLNDDHLAAPLSDDYSSLNLGRVIDKAIIIAYTTYIDYIMDNIAVDENGQIPTGICKDFEAAIIRAVSLQMAGEISSFNAYINPAQNVISSGEMQINCTIVPTATLKKITVNLSFNNPYAD